jgi:hypothetical protein
MRSRRLRSTPRSRCRFCTTRANSLRALWPRGLDFQPHNRARRTWAFCSPASPGPSGLCSPSTAEKYPRSTASTPASGFPCRRTCRSSQQRTGRRAVSLGFIALACYHSSVSTSSVPASSQVSLIPVFVLSVAAAACGSQGRRCDGRSIPFLNNCAMLQSHFPCEAGCGHQVGDEIPCYVSDPQQPTHRQCLISDEGKASCGAAHRSTRRICPCLPA